MNDQFTLKPLISAEMLNGWREEYALLYEKSRAINRRLLALSAMIENGQTLLPSGSDESDVSVNRLASDAKPATTIPEPEYRMQHGTWTSTIYEILEEANRGMTHAEIREEVKKTPLAAKLERTEKSFYGAIDKLTTQGKLIKHHGKVYTKRAHRIFLKAVEAGTETDVNVGRLRPESMASAVIKFLETKPNGALSAEIINELTKDDEFKRRIDNNPSTPYNVISLLRKRKNIRKGENGAYHLSAQ